MAKTKEEYQAAIDEVRAVCKKHGVVLIGLSLPEMVWADIEVFDAKDWGASSWAVNKDANVVKSSKYPAVCNGFVVGVIGDKLE